MKNITVYAALEVIFLESNDGRSAIAAEMENNS